LEVGRIGEAICKKAAVGPGQLDDSEREENWGRECVIQSPIMGRQERSQTGQERKVKQEIEEKKVRCLRERHKGGKSV